MINFAKSCFALSHSLSCSTCGGRTKKFLLAVVVTITSFPRRVLSFTEENEKLSDQYRSVRQHEFGAKFFSPRDPLRVRCISVLSDFWRHGECIDVGGERCAFNQSVRGIACIDNHEVLAFD